MHEMWVRMWGGGRLRAPVHGHGSEPVAETDGQTDGQTDDRQTARISSGSPSPPPPPGGKTQCRSSPGMVLHGELSAAAVAA